MPNHKAAFMLLLLLPLAALSLENPERLFQQANQAYQKKHYQKATNLYDSLRKAGYASPNLYFNLGNAYYKLNRMPESILFYEKAQKNSGFREDVTHNLSLAREQIPDDVEMKQSTLLGTWWNNAVRYFSLSTWSKITVVLIWLACLSFAGFLTLIRERLKRLALVTGPIAILLFIGSMVLTAERYQYSTQNHHAVIFSPRVDVKRAPDPKSEKMFILHAGTKVALKNELERWQKIRLPNGEQGWVKENALRTI